jgi:selenocysteine-specific translation elongation factor
VLLLVDASFGFEMETFEFLNICQVHGFPRIMGVLTHLDSFKDNKRMRKTKKRLKHRFWTEVYQVSNYNDRITHVCITTQNDEVSMGFPLSFFYY